MKTVLFIEHTKTLFEQVEIGHGYNQLDVREYVLASEANERIKVLEVENNKLSELFDAAGQDNNILHERIKVLEDALKEILDGHLWRDERPNIEIMRETARAALEVK